MTHETVSPRELATRLAATVRDLLESAKVAPTPGEAALILHDLIDAQGLLVQVEHPEHGPLTLPGPVLRLDDQPYAGGRQEHLHPPGLDEHGEAIRAWLA